MTNEEAKNIINMYVGALLMVSMGDPNSEIKAKTYEKYKEAAKIACDAIDMVTYRLELERREDENGNK